MGDSSSLRTVPRRGPAAIQLGAPDIRTENMVSTVKSNDGTRMAFDRIGSVPPVIPQRRTLAGQEHGVSAEAIAPVLTEFFSG